MTVPPALDPRGARAAADRSTPAAFTRTETLSAGAPAVQRWRRLFEWSGTSAPVAVLLASGIALGPQGINLIAADALAVVEPAIPVALAMLGVLVGLSVGIGKGSGRLAVTAAADSTLSLVIVAVGIGGLAHAGALGPIPANLILVAGAGICAASSLTLPTGNPLEPRTTATRLVELGVLVPILLGGLLLGWIRTGSLPGTLLSIAVASCLICILATAAWLLLTATSSETEQRVVTIAALLLVGGASDALSTSALFVGVVAGLFWRLLGGRPLESVGRDILFIQHPLLVVVLLAAGATATFPPASLAAGAAYAVLRVPGRLAGGAVAAHVVQTAMPGGLGRHLLPPGVFGAAFALNAIGVVGADASMLLGAVVVGTIAAELVSFRLPPARTDA